MEVQLPEVDRMQHELAEMREEIRRLRELVDPPKRWYTREECARLKGVAKSTLDKYPWLYPAFNRGKRVGRRDLFHYTDVATWLDKTDLQLTSEYEAWKRERKRARKSA